MKSDVVYIWILFTLLLLLMLFGACIFTNLESNHEVELAKKYHDMLMKFQRDNNISSNLMKQFISVHVKTCNIGIPNKTIKKWDFIGSFFFSGTILTTIGFGNAPPLTFLGQLCCILYAIVGIPINILFMNLILEKSITVSTNLVAKFTKTKDATQTLKGGNLPLLRLTLVFTALYSTTVLVLASVFSFIEDWTYAESLYFVFISFTTIGLGDLVPSTNTSNHNMHGAYRVLSWFFIMFGVVAAYVFFSLSSTLVKSILDKCLSKLQMLPCLQKQNRDFITPSKTHQSFRKKSRSRSAISSISNFEERVGAFAIIQSVIDKMRKKIEDKEDVWKELEAVDRIEHYLNREYDQVKLRKSRYLKSKWQNAANKARKDSSYQKNKKKYFCEEIFELQYDVPDTHTLSPIQSVNIDSSHSHWLTSTPMETAKSSVNKQNLVHQQNNYSCDTDEKLSVKLVHEFVESHESVETQHTDNTDVRHSVNVAPVVLNNNNCSPAKLNTMHCDVAAYEQDVELE